MGNLKKLKTKVKMPRMKCPRCAGKMHGKPYDDGYTLFICTKCKFPKRVKQS